MKRKEDQPPSRLPGGKHNPTYMELWYEGKREQHLSTQMYKRYGITRDEKYTMWIKQDQTCAICKEELPDWEKAHVDHNHNTGAVRGILCVRCNMGMTMFDDRSIFFSALDYIERNGGE